MYLLWAINFRRLIVERIFLNKSPTIRSRNLYRFAFNSTKATFQWRNNVYARSHTTFNDVGNVGVQFSSQVPEKPKHGEPGENSREIVHRRHKYRLAVEQNSHLER